MSRTCAYSLWLCHNATDKSASQEILPSTGTSAPSGGQRVSGKGMVTGPQARSACTHPGARMHAGPTAFTCARPHIRVRNGQTHGRARSGVLALSSKSHTRCHITHVPTHPHPRACTDARSIRCARANHDTCCGYKLALGVPVCRCSKQRLLRWQVHWRVRSARRNAAVIVVDMGGNLTALMGVKADGSGSRMAS